MLLGIHSICMDIYDNKNIFFGFTMSCDLYIQNHLKAPNESIWWLTGIISASWIIQQCLILTIELDSERASK